MPIDAVTVHISEKIAVANNKPFVLFGGINVLEDLTVPFVRPSIL